MDKQDNLNVIDVKPEEAQQLAKTDLNFLAALCLADQMLFLFPNMFIYIWSFLLSKVTLIRDFSKLALGIPRGFAKTTLIKIWIIFCILFTDKKFIVVISHNEDHAINIIKDVCDMLTGQNILGLFGDWRKNIERNQAACKIFNFRGKRMILGAIGAKGSIRGLNLGNDRPDMMVFEDYQDKKESESEDLSNALYKEMHGTAMKACSPFGCMYIFVANMYPTQGSILKKLKNNKDWISIIVGAILSDNTSLWEELQPLEQLLKEYETDLNANCPEVFLSEKLNDENAGIKAGINITKLPVFPWDDDELPQGRAVVIDPSLDNPTSDYNGIGLVGIYDGIPCLEQVKLKRYTPYELIQQAIILALQTGTKLICVENVAYQASLLFWFNHIAQANGISGFHFMPLNVQGGRSKNAKIMTALKEHEKGEILVRKEVKPLLVNEIIKFNPLKKNNQDTILDLLTFCKKVQEQYSELMTMEYEADYQLVQTASPRELEENCNF